MALALFACLYGSTSVAAVKDSVRFAVNVLKGMEDGWTKAQAVEMLQYAASRNNPVAMNSLGVIYMRGICVRQDSTLAEDWFLKAAQNGYSDAYHNLGMMYKNATAWSKAEFQKGGRLFCGRS